METKSFNITYKNQVLQVEQDTDAYDEFFYKATFPSLETIVASDFLFETIIVNYDRSWDIKPDEQNMQYFKAVMELLESLPQRPQHEQQTL